MIPSRKSSAAHAALNRRQGLARLFVFITVVLGTAFQSQAEVGLNYSPLFTLDTRYGLGVRSNQSGLFILDTRLSANTGIGASLDFTLDTRGALVANVFITGRVTDSSGNNLSGATVRALFSNRLQASSVTDSSGNYALPLLPAGTYEMRASKTGYVTGIRAFQNFTPGESATIHYFLSVLPAPPATESVNQVPPPPPSPPTPDHLKVWLGSSWQNAPLDPSKMTIVLTHGWRSSHDAWPTVMAQRFSSSPGNIPTIANIVAWDWEDEAAGINLNSAYSRTPAQGEALAQALYQSLGANYNKQLHFNGHSLGSLVNAKAANYLHANAYPYQRTHMTLLDNAVLANVAGPLEGAALAGAMAGANAATISLAISTSRLLQRGWVSPIPDYAGWIDNYISLVGIPYSKAVNILLANGPIFASSFGPIGLHGYSYEWYGDSVLAPTSSLLGNRYSFERQTVFTDSSPYPANSYFVQNNSLNGMSLRSLNTAEEIDNFQALLLLTVGRVTVTEVAAAIQGPARTVGNVIVSTVEVPQNAFQNAVNAVGVNNLLVGPIFTEISVNVASLQCELNTMPPAGIKPGTQAADDNDTNTAAYVWLTIAIPSNAVSMSFDFELHGDGKDDTLLFGINNTNQFALETRFIPPDTEQNSGSIDVRQWSGTNAEFFFGIAGGTSTNATMTIEGIRFYAEVPPSLVASVHGNELVLKWPVSAADYLLESTTDLNTSNNWATVTSSPALVEFQNTVTNSISVGNKFYRLRKLPPSL